MQYAQFDLLFISAIIFIVSISAKEILSLPGWKGTFNFRQYSGYLKASDTHFLHYWFVESQGSPAADPFLVWLTGGPGCSSLSGLITELGPFSVAEDGETLKLNNYTWNKLANILYLESPAGVGYSYSTDGNTTTDDLQTASENYQALKQFFTEFPRFMSHDLYITGESYGGIYVPTLVENIIKGNQTFPLNLKGMAIGNGLLSSNMNTDTLMEFAYAHGLVDNKLWNTVQTVCCQGCADTCAYHSVKSTFCQSFVANTSLAAWGAGLNVYDLYRDCFHSPDAMWRQSRFRSDLLGVAPTGTHALLLQAAKPKNKSVVESVQKRMGYGTPVCLNETAPTLYLNKIEVRKALHIPPHLPRWETCSDDISKNYKKVLENVYAQFRLAILAKLRILIYNGDADMACNFLMGQRFSGNLGLPILNAKRSWKEGDQIAGFVTQYRGLDFVTIKGAGHMVPEWRPAQALHMIQSFLKQTSY